MATRVKKIIKRIKGLGDKDIAAHSLRFFKTGKGEYGEGDIFLGIRVPTIRKCVKESPSISLEEAVEILKSPFHEIRLFALLIMVAKYGKAQGRGEQTAIYRAYLKNTAFINNWDLVDLSAHPIVGAHLFDRERTPLYRLARSRSLWERRISIVATYHFIKRDDFSDTLAIAERLLNDKEDLMHKASGWMLREVGKRNKTEEEKFLSRHYKRMPRTMLRYAIERFPERERKAYLLK